MWPKGSDTLVKVNNLSASDQTARLEIQEGIQCVLDVFDHRHYSVICHVLYFFRFLINYFVGNCLQ